jgi:predicted AlkP superfamily pyrophosphatase or phosphodiesterase
MTDPELPEVFSLSNREALNNPRWWSEATPLWVTLKEQGKRSSTLFWPGSEVQIHGVQPNDWLPYQHQMPHAERIKTLIQWLSRPNATRADFATLYFSDVDSAGHQYGPDSEQVRLASRAVDQSLGMLIQEFKRLGLWDRTTMIIVSDHGMSKVEHSIVVASLLPSNSKARWEWTGALAGIRLMGEDAAPILQQLGQISHVQCWPKDQMPSRFSFGHHRRIPDIVCLADPGYALTVDSSRKGPLGQHGYDPMDESMWGILIASGHRIQAQSSGLVANIDIYPFLCQLLGVTPSPHDGDPSTLKSWLVKP